MAEKQITHLLKPSRSVGIVGYGAYVPRYRLPASEVTRIWMGGVGGSPITEKSVPGLDEDTTTMAIEAGRNALLRAKIPPSEIRAVWVGSESPPYAVKPTSTIVAEALGIVPSTQAADFEFACKAGSEAMVAAFGLVGSEMANYAMAMGMDTAQGKPGDALEYTAAAGGACYIIGPAEEALAILEGAYSYVTDTPDFWRRAHQKYPEHGHRFTGGPAYFTHTKEAVTIFLDETGTTPEDYQYAIFHQPNAKFPHRVAKQLGFSVDQITPGLLSPEIGNTYAGAALIGLSATLDIAKPGDRILMVSFGSGAGSDAFAFHVTEEIISRREKALKTRAYIARRTEIDYAQYVRMRRKLALR